MLLVRGALREYAWGARDGLEPWLGWSTGGPQAELWFGAHPSAPSPLTEGARTLDDCLPPGEAPLLVKLLAAAEPLSIQVHPDAELAAAAFAAQAAPGAEQVYADGAEKTEMLVAIEPFEVLAGWRDRLDAEGILRRLPGGEKAADLLAAAGFVAAIPALLEAGPAAAAAVPEAVLGAGAGAAEVAAYRRILDHYPGDPGVPVAALLRYRRLEPGQGLYVPAGVPHSYLRGRGVEVMTSSDNVVRLGLTPKPIHVAAALAALSESAHPELVAGDGWLAPSGAPFAIRFEHGVEMLPSGSYRVALCLEGSVVVQAGDAAAELEPGEAAVLPAADPAARVSASGRATLVQAR